jgi:hypothetical protein
MQQMQSFFKFPKNILRVALVRQSVYVGLFFRYGIKESRDYYVEDSLPNRMLIKSICDLLS